MHFMAKHIDYPKPFIRRCFTCLVAMTSKSLPQAMKTLSISNHKMGSHLFKRGGGGGGGGGALHPPPLESHMPANIFTLRPLIKKPDFHHSPWLESLFLSLSLSFFLLWLVPEECCQGNVMMTLPDSSLNHSLISASSQRLK